RPPPTSASRPRTWRAPRSPASRCTCSPRWCRRSCCWSRCRVSSSATTTRRCCGGRSSSPSSCSRSPWRSASSESADRTGMTDLYSTPHRRFPAPSLRVAASPGIDEAEATVVLALRPDASPAVCQEAIAAARRENAGLRAIVFDTDTTTAPSTSPLAECTRLGAALAEAGLEYEVRRVGSDLAEQVLDLATQHAALLIVMAAKRRSPVVKLLLGSSASRSSSRPNAPCCWRTESDRAEAAARGQQSARVEEVLELLQSRPARQRPPRVDLVPYRGRCVDQPRAEVVQTEGPQVLEDDTSGDPRFGLRGTDPEFEEPGRTPPQPQRIADRGLEPCHGRPKPRNEIRIHGHAYRHVHPCPPAPPVRSLTARSGREAVEDASDIGLDEVLVAFAQGDGGRGRTGRAFDDDRRRRLSGAEECRGRLGAGDPHELLGRRSHAQFDLGGDDDRPRAPGPGEKPRQLATGQSGAEP